MSKEEILRNLKNVQMPDTPENVRVHAEICEKLHRTYEAKNADYGDSFARVRKKYQNAILIRLNDKLNRLESLENGQCRKVPDESVEDTLLDMANYCIMELVEREMERKHADTKEL